MGLSWCGWLHWPIKKQAHRSGLQEAVAPGLFRELAMKARETP